VYYTHHMNSSEIIKNYRMMDGCFIIQKAIIISSNILKNQEK
jgi:hypothetical protein